ncbi:MAG: 7-cyano-7-deazaguanine synthase QueC [Proteobacteria bacterium]|nr:7-cyano-7-deazaguanine synthase QueC [Pseudomonadota bacterium]NOG60748.1 7-cyano-7-deazaguanine synthase QueC [Pseudomonadota bacterium]
MTNYNKAIVLVSGGLDSTTTLAIAKDLGFDCYALSFNYGQRHISEINAAKKIAATYNVLDHKVINLDMGQIGGSALTDSNIDVPEVSSEGIPITYVPARNTIFLSYALAWAEVIDANDIFIGVNAVDYSGYPDCRPEYIKAYEQLATLATKAGVEGASFKIHTPLIELSKAEIIQKGISLDVDYGLTVSCYQADEKGKACGVCDSCRFRKEGFETAKIADPTYYK